jgi:uncharacterized membrane protein
VEYLDLLGAVLLGLSLSATCGLRAFLPLFVLSILSWSGRIDLADSFSWMGTQLAMICFGAAVVFEIAGDKIPVVDHFLDSVAVVVKPVAAAVASASVLTEVDPMISTVLGLVIGGTIAGGVHLVKAKLRLLSSALTMAVANPILSLLEDLLAVIGTVLSFLMPLLVVLLFLGLFGGTLWWANRRRGPGKNAVGED